MKVRELLKQLILPMSTERPCTYPSGSEVKRWCLKQSVILNQKPVMPEEEVEFPVTSLVFFPKGRKTTYV